MRLFSLRLSLKEAQVAARWSVLTADERARADRFRFARDRRRFIVCRAGLRRLLGSLLDVAPQAVRFRYGRWGKPGLDGQLAGALRFNVAHTGDLAVVVVSPSRRVGVDIEAVRPLSDVAALAASVFSPAERERILATTGRARLMAFYRQWTLKEAWLKAVGTGLREKLQDVEVLDGEGSDGLAVRRRNGGRSEVLPWCVWSGGLLQGAVLAVAASGVRPMSIELVPMQTLDPHGCRRSPRRCRRLSR